MASPQAFSSAAELGATLWRRESQGCPARGTALGVGQGLLPRSPLTGAPWIPPSSGRVLILQVRKPQHREGALWRRHGSQWLTPVPGLPHQAPPPPGRALRSPTPSQQQPVGLNFRDSVRKCDDYKLNHSEVPRTWGRSCGWRTQGGCGVVPVRRPSWREGLPGSQMPQEERSVDPTRGRLRKPRRETPRVTRRPLVPGPVWAVMCFSVYVLAPQGIPWW